VRAPHPRSPEEGPLPARGQTAGALRNEGTAGRSKVLLDEQMAFPRVSTTKPSGLRLSGGGGILPGMSTKSREVVWGGQIMGAKILAQGARERAQKAAREADRAEAEACSVRDGRLRRPVPNLPRQSHQRRHGLA
jgi:hypothetical protein